MTSPDPQLPTPGPLLYDSRRKRIERLTTHLGPVRMYVCGITPYDTTHLGHAFTYLIFDVLGRNLRRHGLGVSYVQNVTDVDDDLLRRARRDQRDWQELAAENVEIFRADLQALQVIPPDFYPYASHEVPVMLEMIGGLLEHGQAYSSGGNVYFRVAAAPHYGELSGLSRDQMLQISAERGADPSDPRKEDPLDFVLWQESAPDEPRWEAPWGAGRPGWHIECSAMAYRYLGEQIEIHGGGGDLIFPHHESEIAQSEAFTGRHPFAQFWLHTGMLRYQGEKMSKSLGNMLFVRDLRQQYSGDALRLSLLCHHYRESFNFEEPELDEAQALANGLAAAAADRSGPAADDSSLELAQRAMAALDHDLDTPGVCAALKELLQRPPSAARSDAIRQVGTSLGLTLEAQV
jgi:L-cysteine:1D-myo-inositol 2-amino-2-deoxy-alpha-D-glucopyranoside ligase